MHYNTIHLHSQMKQLFVSNVIFFVLIATTSARRMANEKKNVCTESERDKEGDRVKLADTC